MEGISIYVELSAPSKKTGLSRIYIRFDSSGKHIGLDKIRRKVSPSDWDFEKKRVKDGASNSKLINSIIDGRLLKHQKFVLKREAFDLPLNQTVLDAYLSINSGFENFYEYAEHILENKKLKDGEGYSEDSKRRYRDEIKRMMQFQPALHINAIKVQWLEKYKLWLQNDYRKADGSRLHENSIWKALTFVRMVYKQAVKDELFFPDSNPFASFEVGSFSTDYEKIKWLEISQVDASEDVLINKRDQITYKMAGIGWRFLAMCVSGLRISDAMALDDYFFNDAGDLEFKPYKTRRHNNKAVIPMATPRQRRYFAHAMQYKLTSTSAKNFRTTFNNYLRVLAAHVGIKIEITSHTGRHTMGGFLVDAAIEDRPARSILGVKSGKTLETYMHVKKNKLQSEAEKLKNVM